MVDLSVVIPVYHSAGCLEELHRRLRKVLDRITPRHEILFVEDGGRDNSWDVLERIAKHDRKVIALRLSRNFGQHAAITAGLSQCSGKWAVVMDGDLQDPPEEIPRFFEKSKQGFDIIFSKRKQMKREFWRSLVSRFYFKMINFFNQSNIDREFGNFTMLSRKVINAFLNVRDKDRHYLFILYWLGFRAGIVEYVHGERPRGKSSYSFDKLIQHAFNGLFFQTTVLLRWIVYLGFSLSFLGSLAALYILYQYLFHSVLPGWTSLFVLILLVGGFIVISTGVTGLYIGKIFEQTKGRPLFLVDEVAGRTSRR
jgi:polyisoprenyl-phosphate glycosyltransferase